MSTKSPFCRYRLYLCAMGGMTLLTLILRTLALFLSMDPEVGYFADGALSVLLTVIEVASLAACLALPLLVKAGELPRGRAPLSLSGLIGTGVSALLFAATAIYLLVRIDYIPAPVVLCLLAALCLLAGATYFVFEFLGKGKPALGFGVILAVALLLSITYFDRYTPMNAPHKTALHLCLLSIMLFMLYEVRAAIGRDLPRALSVTSAIAFLFCATVGVSDLIAFIAGIYTDPLYLMGDLLVLGFAIYVAARAVADLMRLHSAEPVAPAEADTEDPL